MATTRPLRSFFWTRSTQNVSIFVGNLPFRAEQEDVIELFAQFGEVTNCALPLERDTGRKRGFAFVEMGDEAAEAAAIEGLQGAELMGRPLRINKAEPRGSAPRRGGGGGYGGGYGGGGRDGGAIAAAVVTAEAVVMVVATAVAVIAAPVPAAGRIAAMAPATTPAVAVIPIPTKTGEAVVGVDHPLVAVTITPATGARKADSAFQRPASRSWRPASSSTIRSAPGLWARSPRLRRQ